MKIKPTTKDGKETVTLYGTTVDVTDKKEFTLFKRNYTVDRGSTKKKSSSKSSKKTKAHTEADKTNES